MIQEEILRYIRYSLAAGDTPENIRKTLLANGWQDADITEAFAVPDTAEPVQSAASAPAAIAETRAEKPRMNVRLIAVLLAGVLLLIGAGAVYFTGGRKLISKLVLLQKPDVRIFGVSEKISQSAAIIVSLPDGVLPEAAQAAITFDPAIAGAWLPADTAGHAVTFKPEAKLEPGKHYAVSLALADGNYQSEFLADEDPKVVAAFPKEGSEADEHSAITLVFSRPILALTTREELDAQRIPVEITPETKGKFKWISTRNLQFIPEGRLVRSARYTVRLNDGLMSADGLAVPAFAFNFITRPLRYMHTDITHGGAMPGGVTVYNRPVRFAFNQPVDLDRTKAEITVERITGADAAKVAFMAEYGKREVYDAKTKKYVTMSDRSLLDIYQGTDRHGREKFWDFENNYRITIAKAFPLEGAITLDQSLTVAANVTRAIQSISADSPRTKFASQNLFDPEGKLTVSFYEAVDRSKTVIEASGLKSTAYGEKCKEPAAGTEVQYGDPDACEKEPDESKLVLAFDEKAISYGQEIKLTFKKIVNRQGMEISGEPIVETVRAIPVLSILRTDPAKGAGNGSVGVATICTNSPLVPLKNEDFEKALTTNLPVQFESWYVQFVERAWPGSLCHSGEFQNTISYRLVPESAYRMTIEAEDDFGQKAGIELAFTSAKLPDYSRNFLHFQDHYTVTTPDKTKLTYAVENLEYVNLHICRVSATGMLGYLEDKPDYTEPPSVLTCMESRQERIALPSRFWVKNYFSIDLKDYVGQDTGHWVLSFSNPDYQYDRWNSDTRRSERSQIFERTYVTVTNLAATEKRVERSGNNRPYSPKDNLSADTLKGLENLYWVVDAKTLEPVQGATVDLYADGQKSGSASTDQKGIAKTKTVWNLRGAIVTAGNDSALIAGAENRFSWATTAETAERMYLYTDRPIYKPGDEVSLKGLYRIGYDGNYEVFKDKKFPLEVFNSRNESVYKKENVTVNDFGTFNDRMRIPADAPLGTWRIQALGGTATFDVEEYVAAPFKVEAKTAKEEYIAGDTMELKVAADYYFGVPLEGGEVSYSIASQDYHFDRFGNRTFSFGMPWYACYESCEFGDKFILRGKAPLGPDGKAAVSQTLDFSKFFKGNEGNDSKIFVVYVTVKNPNGQSVSTQHSFIVHRADFYIGVSASKSFLAKNEAFTVRAKTVDVSGKERSAGNVQLELNKITWRSFRRKEVDGGYYWRWEQVKERIKGESFATDSHGDWSGEFKVAEEGEYEITAKSTDSHGNPAQGVEYFYVYGEGAASVRPSNDTELEIVAAKSDLSPGDEAEIIIKSPYTHAKALITIERGKVYTYEVVDISQNIYRYRFPVEERYLPNVFATVVLLSGAPEIKYGQAAFTVNAGRERVDIGLSTNKAFYLPGERVDLSVFAKDYAGKPLATEVSVAVVDLSVLALKGNPKKDPLVFFYNGFPLTVSTGSNIKNILHEIDIAALAGDKGGGGLEPDDLARRKRGEFRDTAFWQADVTTDGNGRTSLSFTLPDNLTTWQIESLGITQDTKVGVAYKEFTSRKELMLVPLAPRFIIPGDEFMVGAKIFNQTAASQLLTVKFESPTLESADGKTSVTRAVDKGSTETVYFPVRAPQHIEDGPHRFTLTAENQAVKDAVEGSIPVTRNNTYETVATAGFTKNDLVREFVTVPGSVVAGKGGLSVNSSATLAVFLSDALQYLAQYPYGCSEQIASKLSAIGILKRSLALKNIGDKLQLKDVEFEGQKYSVDEVVKIGLQRMYESEVKTSEAWATSSDPSSRIVSGGGFAYYRDLQPNFYLSLHILNALLDLKKAGYEVRQDVVARTVSYLTRMVAGQSSQLGTYQNGIYGSGYTVSVYAGSYANNRDALILTAYAISRADGFAAEKQALKNRVLPLLKDQKFLNEDISDTTLAYFAMLASLDRYPDQDRDSLFNVLLNRTEIDGRGAYLGTNARNILWSFYETPIKNTALLVKALATAKRNDAISDKLVRWIVKSRAKDGAWGSSQNTLAVVDAFTDYLAWQRETEAQFTVRAAFDGAEKGTFSFGPATILEALSVQIPMAEIGPNSLHTLTITRENPNGPKTNLYYDAALKYFLPADKIPARDEGFTIERAFYGMEDKGLEHPVQEAKAGDVLRERLTITVPKARNLVSVEDFVPAGTEIVNLNLATEDQSLKNELPKKEFYGALTVPSRDPVQRFLASILGTFGADERYYDEMEEDAPLSIFRADREESHKDRLFLFKEQLDPGVYTYDYFVRALVPGTFAHLPAAVTEMYFPENFGRTAAGTFTVQR